MVPTSWRTAECCSRQTTTNLTRHTTLTSQTTPRCLRNNPIHGYTSSILLLLLYYFQHSFGNIGVRDIKLGRRDSVVYSAVLYTVSYAI